MREKVLGIDLGTTFSAVAYVNDHGRAEVIANREGERTTPSVVLFEGDVPVVGSMAKRSAVANPLGVCQFIKRQMGNPAFKFVTENGAAYSAEEVSAIILRRLREDAESMLGETVAKAVVTVPAYFNDAQRKATQDAGRIAGIDVLRIVNEPTAAALAYASQKGRSAETILVYDLGGGTFDVTILRLRPDAIDVVATGGDKNLGGFDWDNVLMQHLDEQFRKEHGIGLLDNPMLEQDLRDKAEIAKRTLSAREKTSIFLSASGQNSSLTITCDAFEDMTSALTRRTGTILGSVLDDARLDWGQIDRVLLVGGSTRMRAIPKLIHKLSGKKASSEVHPDEVVAMGAALQAEITHAEYGGSDLVERGTFDLVEIRDVSAHSLGVIALDDDHEEANCIIVQRNTRVPCSASDVFRTVEDGQRILNVRVTQGEDRDIRYVDVVNGDGDEFPIPPYPRGAPIKVSFEYDSQGTIHVKLFDMTAGVSLGEMKITRKQNKSDEEVRRAANRISKLAVG